VAKLSSGHPHARFFRQFSSEMPLLEFFNNIGRSEPVVNANAE
jgi:hypothetical protein